MTSRHTHLAPAFSDKVIRRERKRIRKSLNVSERAVWDLQQARIEAWRSGKITGAR